MNDQVHLCNQQAVSQAIPGYNNPKTGAIQMLKPGTCQNTGGHHEGLYAKNSAASAEFCLDLLCMQIVGRSEFAQLGHRILLREPFPPLDIGPNPSFNKISS
jgi:hypothetical protein